MTATDIAIPIVFPDYLIVVATPANKVDLPGKMFDFTIPATKNKIPYLGHAGILFLSGKTGTTKYFEYGRYDPKARGLVRRQAVLDAKVAAGKPTRRSLVKVLEQISQRSGQKGRVSGAYIELGSGAYSKMLAYSAMRMVENNNSKRVAYDLDDHSCLHFMRDVAIAGGAAMPPVLDPRPVGYIDRVRDKFPAVDFSMTALTVEGVTLP